jgi:hypothetical protein
MSIYVVIKTSLGKTPKLTDEIVSIEVDEKKAIQVYEEVKLGAVSANCTNTAKCLIRTKPDADLRIEALFEEDENVLRSDCLPRQKPDTSKLETIAVFVDGYNMKSAQKMVSRICYADVKEVKENELYVAVSDHGLVGCNIVINPKNIKYDKVIIADGFQLDFGSIPVHKIPRFRGRLDPWKSMDFLQGIDGVYQFIGFC